jgi:hypothetical protein
MESQTSGDWAKKLSPEEASLATRYAVEELNELPPWIMALYIAHPSAVAGVLIEEIGWEMSLPEDRPTHSYVLSRLLWNAKELGDILRPKLIEAIQKNPQANSSALLSSLSKHQDTAAECAREARKQVALLAPGRVRDALIEKAEQYEAEMREKVLSD